MRKLMMKMLRFGRGDTQHESISNISPRTKNDPKGGSRDAVEGMNLTAKDAKVKHSE